MYHKKIVRLGVIPSLVIMLAIQPVHTSRVEEEELKVVNVISPKVDHFKQQEEVSDVRKKLPLASTGQKIGLGLVGLIGTGLTFTLEVLGATDVFGLRDETNDEQYRIAAMAIGGVAFLRYLSVHAFNSQKYQDYLTGIDRVKGFSKIVKAFEMPIPAVKTALAEVFCCGTKPRQDLSKKDFFTYSQDDSESDTAILLKCSSSKQSVNCDDRCLKPQLKQRKGAKKLYECQLNPLEDSQ